MATAMDLDAPIALPIRTGTAGTGATVLCCNCGAPIDGTAAGALCYDCIKLTVDASKGIEREAVLNFCRDCHRWLLPPTSWQIAAPESRELLAMCLKRLRGLNKVRIIDASFIWTEPHSRRIKVRLTVQDSVSDGVVLQQTFEVVYVVAYQQCPECAKSYTANVWTACVQVRQKVLHKRTFLYLEQVLLKHGAHRETLNIKETKGGIDFFFAKKNQALKLVDFISSVAPVRVKKSQDLISSDTQSGKSFYKHTFSVELIPICKDDMVVLPLNLAKQLGNISPLVLCYRVGTALNFLDPTTLQTSELASPIYWRTPFESLAEAPELVELMVLNCEPVGPSKGRWMVADVEVARMDEMDKVYTVRSHLGNFLNAGDSAMGYMLTNTIYNNPQFEEMEASHTFGSRIPDIVLVKKQWPRNRKSRRRNWQLKRMEKDEGDLLPKKADQKRLDNEYEMFLRDVEEDEDMRAALALYKAKNDKRAAAGGGGMDIDQESVAETEGDGGDDDAPKVNMEELLDDFDDLTVADHAEE